ncbi:MAG: hypothetical protein K2X87_05270 [Gemmataceae bacterium]|nr:hypothetical protein [Gemmataceae bacterium]
MGLTDRPEPVRQYLPLERLTFDPRLQLRDLPGGKLYDEETAADYAAHLADGGEFADPLGVVEDRSAGDARYWVYAGYHRGEAYRRVGRPSVPCLIHPGTYTDAKLRALGENARHGLRRSPGDQRKAVAALLADPALVARVCAAGKGVHEAVAAACGVGRSTVTDALTALGLRVHAGKVVPRTEPVRPAQTPTAAGLTVPPPGPPPVTSDADGDTPLWTASPPPPAAVLPPDLIRRANELYQKARLCQLRGCDRGVPPDLVAGVLGDLLPHLTADGPAPC